MEIQVMGSIISIYTIGKKEISESQKLYGRFYVYFLLKDREVIYVGYTKSIYNRFLQHNANSYECRKDYDSAILFEYKTLDEAKFYEKQYISLYKPKMNKNLHNKIAKGMEKFNVIA